jgi:hypothetical protein
MRQTLEQTVSPDIAPLAHAVPTRLTPYDGDGADTAAVIAEIARFRERGESGAVIGA